MCLAVPMKLIRKEGSYGIVERGGIEYKAGLQLVENAKVGDYLLIHAGFAIQILDEKEALETIEIFKEIERLNKK